MLTSKLVASFSLLATGLSFAALGDIANSFPAPADKPRAAARGPDDLYVYCSTWGDNIWRLNPSSGSVVGTFPSPFGVFTEALSYSWGNNLWIGSWYDNFVYRCTADTGSILSSWPADHNFMGLAVECEGDGGFNPQAIFASNVFPRGIWRHDLTTGSILSSFSGVKPFVDICWDWRNNLIWGGYTSTIYGYRPNGSLVASFPSPADLPNGFAYYAEYLYVTTSSDNYVWQIHCPAFAPVAPTSFGKIKAFFQ